MKKLMIAAATAALAAGAFAAEPQVYEMTLTVKSTQCATGKKTVKVCEDIEFTSYRKQVTRKYEGLFWGCGCEVIACPTYYFKGLDFDHDTVAPNQETDYIFWSATKGFQYGLYGENDAFQWQILQLVGPKAQNIEGTWTLQLKNNADEIVLDVQGAGYGTAFDICTEEDAKIKSMSGYVVGSVDYAAEEEVSGCQYCGELTQCTPFQFCDCIEVQEKTALFGSWTLKYNSSAAKKLAQGKYIEAAYKFPKYLNLGNYTEGTDDGTTEQTAAQKAKKAYDEAKAAVTTAETAVATAQAGLEDLAEVNADGTFKAYKAAAKTTKGKELAAAEKAAKRAADDAADEVTDATAKTTDAKNELNAETVSGADKLGVAYVTAQDAIVAAQDEIDKQQKIIDESTDAGEIAKAKKAIAPDSDLQKNLANAKDALANVQKKIDALDAEKKGEITKLVSAYDKAVTDEASAKKAKDAAAEEYKKAQDATTLWAETGDEKKEGTMAKAKADAEKAVKSAKDALNKAETELATYRAACIATGATCD